MKIFYLTSVVSTTFLAVAGETNTESVPLLDCIRELSNVIVESPSRWEAWMVVAICTAFAILFCLAALERRWLWLGLKYARGRQTEKNPKFAVKNFRKAAILGNALAQLKLAESYRVGFGVAKNEFKAAEWNRRANTCLSKVQHNLADEKKKHADELFTRGFCYENGIDVAKDVVEAAKWYRKAADMGHADALNNLGLMYANGKGVDKDKTEAVWLFNKAAELGNADAQFNLGECYRTGCGVPKDASEAMKWFRKAAEQGNAGGQYALGRCYVDGEGIAKDGAEAVKWFRKAAEQGNAVGQYFLGTCYMDGVGVVKDKAEAVKWLRRAAEQGNEDAIGVLKTLGLDV